MVEQVLEIMRIEKVAVVAGTAAAGRVVQMDLAPEVVEEVHMMLQVRTVEVQRTQDRGTL